MSNIDTIHHQRCLYNLTLNSKRRILDSLKPKAWSAQQTWRLAKTRSASLYSSWIAWYLLILNSVSGSEQFNWNPKGLVFAKQKLSVDLWIEAHVNFKRRISNMTKPLGAWSACWLSWCLEAGALANSANTIHHQRCLYNPSSLIFTREEPM